MSKRLANVMKEMDWTRHDNVVRIAGKACRGFTKVIEEADERRQKLIERLVPLAVVPLAPPLVVKRRKL